MRVDNVLLKSVSRNDTVDCWTARRDHPVADVDLPRPREPYTDLLAVRRRRLVESQCILLRADVDGKTIPCAGKMEQVTEHSRERWNGRCEDDGGSLTRAERVG